MVRRRRGATTIKKHFRRGRQPSIVKIDRSVINQNLKKWGHFFYVYCSSGVPRNVQNKIVEFAFNREAIAVLESLLNNIRRGEIQVENSHVWWRTVLQSKRLIKKFTSKNLTWQQKKLMLKRSGTKQKLREILPPVLKFLLCGNRNLVYVKGQPDEEIFNAESGDDDDGNIDDEEDQEH